MRSLFFGFCRFWLRLRGVSCGKDPKVRGWPMLVRHPQGRITLGDRVVLQSRPLRYHAHMHSPVKLLVDRSGGRIEIGDDTRINGACIHAVDRVTIGARCLIAAGVQILDSNGHEVSMDQPERRIHTVDAGRPVWIGDDVWIGMNAIILPGTRIGSGAVIGAGAVVSGEIPPGSTVRVAAFLVREPALSGRTF